MMPRLVDTVFTVSGMRPTPVRDEFMLSAIRIIREILPVRVVRTLHFLQKNDIRIQLAQSLAQLVQNHPLIKMGKTLVNIIGSYGERLHNIDYIMFYPTKSRILEKQPYRHEARTIAR